MKCGQKSDDRGFRNLSDEHQTMLEVTSLGYFQHRLVVEMKESRTLPGGIFRVHETFLVGPARRKTVSYCLHVSLYLYSSLSVKLSIHAVLDRGGNIAVLINADCDTGSRF